MRLGKVPPEAKRGIAPSGAPRVRFRCSPTAMWPRCTARRWAIAGQQGIVTIALVAERRRADASSPKARETPSVRA